MKRSKKNLPFGLLLHPAAPWLLVPLALVSGYFGSKFWSGLHPRWLAGLPLQALSLGALILAFCAKRPFPGLPKEAALHPEPAVFRTKLPSFLLPLALIILGQTFLQFGWLAPGLAFLGAGAVTLFLIGRPEPPPRARGAAHADALPKENLWLAGVLLVAALLRFPFAGHSFAGLQIDEANNLMASLRITTGELATPYVTSWGTNPNFPYFYMAAFFKLFGPSLSLARALVAVLSLLVLFLFYRWSRFHFPAFPSLVATLLFALSWWHLNLSLSPFHNVYTHLFLVACLYFVERAVRSGRWTDFLMIGLCAGWALLGYNPGRMVVGMALVGLGAYAWRAGGETRAVLLRGGLFAFLVFLWVIGPYLFFVAAIPDEFFGRNRELSLFHHVASSGDWRLLWERPWQTLLCFQWPKNDVDIRFAPPGRSLLDPVAGGLFFLGLWAALKSWRRPLAWMVLPGFALGVAANALAYWTLIPNAINALRFSFILPFLFLLCAWGLQHLQLGARGLKGPWRTSVSALGLAGLLFAGASNARTYFFEFKNDRSWEYLGAGHMMAAEQMLERAGRYHLVTNWQLHSSIVEFLTYGKAKVATIQEMDDLPLRRKAERDVAFFIHIFRYPQGEARVKELYPNAVIVTPKGPFGNESFKIAEIPLEDIRAAQRGLNLGEPLP